MSKKNRDTRAGLSKRIKNLHAKLNELGENGIYTNTKEYSAIIAEISRLDAERSLLLTEYDDLKSKKTL